MIVCIYTYIASSIKIINKETGKPFLRIVIKTKVKIKVIKTKGMRLFVHLKFKVNNSFYIANRTYRFCCQYALILV